jgi:hypothetical protein
MIYIAQVVYILMKYYDLTKIMIFHFAMLNNRRAYWKIFAKTGLKKNAGHLYFFEAAPEKADWSKIGNGFNMI